MNEPRLQQAYARVVAARSGRDRAACVSAEMLRDVIERRGPEEVRLRTINHAAACPHCAPELELLRAMSVARDQSRVRSATVALAASLLLIVAIFVWRATSGGGENGVMRGPESTEIVQPIGEVPVRPRLFIWRAVPGATRYDVEVRQADGPTLARASTGDTVWSLPDTVRIPTGTDVYWTLSARFADGSERRSIARRFRVRIP